MALSWAWDRGAAAWSSDRRRDFANDPRNLVPTTLNSSKSDRGPEEWQPPTPQGRCLYAAKFTETVRHYELVVTQHEASSLGTMLAECDGHQGTP